MGIRGGAVRGVVWYVGVEQDAEIVIGGARLLNAQNGVIRQTRVVKVKRATALAKRAAVSEGGSGRVEAVRVDEE